MAQDVETTTIFNAQPVWMLLEMNTLWCFLRVKLTCVSLDLLLYLTKPGTNIDQTYRNRLQPDYSNVGSVMSSQWTVMRPEMAVNRSSHITLYKILLKQTGPEWKSLTVLWFLDLVMLCHPIVHVVPCLSSLVMPELQDSYIFAGDAFQYIIKVR